MKCPKCHFDNPDDTRFCGNCATPLVTSDEIPPSRTKTLQTPMKGLKRGSTFAKRYEIIEELGKGGMGKVYRVFDKKIEEEVALKLLKPEIAADKDTIKRFSNELKFARKIAHKNVCRMYDLSEEEGTQYITMEYVSGEDLKSFIRRSRQLSVGTAITIARQVCEGLAEAHHLGVVHRDLKPQNIMIDREGNARIMDFGIARSLEAKGVTEAGMMIGTPQYMSPEQVEGKEADQRSDIYSLGVILFEMVTGRVPFEGDIPLSIALKHKTEPPPDPREVNAQIPEDLSRLILRCMEKDKGKRYQKVEELLSELSKIAEPKLETIEMPKWKNSIAVLPFTNMSADPEQEYFCDGMAEEIINALSHIENLKVIARTSAFAFKNKHEDVREIGKKLDVEHLLEGSVRKAGNRLRITAQLIKTADGSHLWSERYDREMEDIFSIQDEISLAIVDNLKVKLLEREKISVLKHHTDNPEVHNLYLLARYHWYKFTEEDITKSQEYFDKAIKLDPAYAPAYAGLSVIYCLIGGASLKVLPPKVAIPKLKDAAEKAFEFDPENDEAHSMLGLAYSWYEWNWPVAEEHLKRAIELNPNSSLSHECYGLHLTMMGRHDEAIREIKRAIELDPITPLLYVNAAHFFYHARRFNQALEYCKRSLELYPNFAWAHWTEVVVYLQKGMFEEVIALAKKLTSTPISEISNALLGYAYGRIGKKAKARQILHDLEARWRNGDGSASGLALLHLGLSEYDKAFQYLEVSTDKCLAESTQNEYIYFTISLKVDPIWDPLRSDPRFTDILRKMGLEK